jgi:protein-tyrosine-phosphatase
MLAGAESILFICHGNIMRSALAPAALYERSRGLQRVLRVRSAGLHAKLDKPADARMRKAALALGVSLENHRATPLSSDLIDAADAVFVMDYLNEAETLTRFPSAKDKLWLLGSLAPTAEEGEIIPDPYTGHEEDAARCAARVCRCIDVLMSLLTQPRAVQPQPDWRESTAAN